jgi:predicted transcriptional regulator
MVNTWLPTADLLENIHPDLRYYELPTISRMNPIARWFINTGMRSGIRDPKSRRKTITLYLDKELFRKALEISGEDSVHILLLDKQGKVIWRSEGSCDAEKAKNLSDFIKNTI